MTTESTIRAPSRVYGEPWPPDDTEESILGTNLHQTTIINLTMGINAAAELKRGSGEPLPWEASDQILVLGWRRPDGSAYRTYPDVFVYPHPIDPNRPSMAIALVPSIGRSPDVRAPGSSYADAIRTMEVGRRDDHSERREGYSAAGG